MLANTLYIIQPDLREKRSLLVLVICPFQQIRDLPACYFRAIRLFSAIG